MEPVEIGEHELFMKERVESHSVTAWLYKTVALQSVSDDTFLLALHGEPFLDGSAEIWKF